MNDQTQLIYNDLKNRYGKSTISKREMANELGISYSCIDDHVRKREGVPPFKKLGTAKNAKVIFSIVDTAKFLAETIETA